MKLTASPRIAAISKVVPSYRFSQETASDYAEQWLSGNGGGVPELSVSKTLQVFNNAGVDTRYGVTPVKELLSERDFEYRNNLYSDHATQLGENALKEVFNKCDIDPSEVDYFITVSCTGFMIPALDAHLINKFPFRTDIKRLPVTQLGCAAGVASMMMAADYIRAYPGSTVLILSVELCTLSFQPDDKSADHIISTAIFGDGAAAMLVTGKKGDGLHLIDTRSSFFRDTLDFMGFDLKNTGYHIFLSPGISRYLRRNLISELQPLLKGMNLDIGDIDSWLFHPGGMRILEAIKESLSIDDRKIHFSREILRKYGNISSATIFFIIEEYMKSETSVGDRYEVTGAVGPGFQLFLIMMEWQVTGNAGSLRKNDVYSESRISRVGNR